MFYYRYGDWQTGAIQASFTQSIDWSDFDRAREQLEACNAFMDPNEADRQGIRLRLP